jgi:glucokinase
MPTDNQRCAGIDVGGTKCLGVVWQDGRIVDEVRRDTPRGADEIIRTLVEIVRELGDVDSVGVGAPGLVTREGVLRAAPNLVEVSEFAVGPRLREILQCDVAVDNDATCAAVAEWSVGAAQGVSDVVVVTLGTGIGGGLVSGGRLVRGTNGFAGEIGHMVVDPSGPQCVCGQQGCWERFASGNGLAYLGRMAADQGVARRVVELAGDVEQIRGEHIRQAASEGDLDALAIVDSFARWVALGLTNLTNLLDPAMIVIGGGLTSSGDLFLEPMKRWFADLLYSPQLRPHPQLVMATFAEHAGAVGAALLPKFAHSSDI